jgi:hypothetical protein
MIATGETVTPMALEWQQMREKCHQSTTLAALVLTAWQMGMWLARAFVEYELKQRAQQPEQWGQCPQCGAKLQSKGFANRQMLTLVGCVEWRRRIGRCPNRCSGSRVVPFDEELEIGPYQQTSTELMRLGCLLAVFLPFGLAVHLLEQLSGVRVSDATLWQWVQHFGDQQINQVQLEVNHWQQGSKPPVEVMDEAVAALPLLIGADGVTVPFRPHPKSSKGKIVYQEIKVALLTRLGSRIKRSGETVTQLVQRRLVALRGTVHDLQPLLELEAHRQQISKAKQVVWVSDGARGFWRLFEQCFSSVAIGILDFYHATQHLFEAAAAYGNTVTERTPQQWFTRLRHQLRHGYVHRILDEFAALLHYASTPDAAKPKLRQVQNYLKIHLKHLQYRQFKKLGLPIGSGMVESACKWLITQRFKGVGMRWSEPGCDHLLHLRVAWVNQRFDQLFGDHPLSPSFYSPN